MLIGSQTAVSYTHLDVYKRQDHISGLPGLLLTMGNAERTEPLTIIGPKGVERIVGERLDRKGLQYQLVEKVG